MGSAGSAYIPLQTRQSVSLSLETQHLVGLAPPSFLPRLEPVLCLNSLLPRNQPSSHAFPSLIISMKTCVIVERRGSPADEAD